MIIQSIGGIHEVYFPYALMHPLLLIPLILAGFSADLVFYLLHAGLVAAPSPGSFLILLGLSPKGDHLAVFAGMLTSAVVSFVTSWLVLSFKKKSERKAPSALAEELPTQEPDMRDTGAFAHSDRPIRKIVFACDAGMGSSVMVAAMFRKHLAEQHIFALVKTASLDEIPQDADLVITIEHLREQAIAKAPQARHLAMKAFNDQAFYKELVQKIKHQHLPQAPAEDQQAEKLHKQGLRSLITPQHIRLGAHAVDKWDAIEQAGRVLVECGHVTKEYIDEMLQRERMHSTYIAGCIALPHGKDAESPHIMGPGIAIVQFAEGVAFADDQKVRIVIAIAGRGEQQLAVLSKVARMIDEDTVRLLLEAKLPEQIIEIIS